MSLLTSLANLVLSHFLLTDLMTFLSKLKGSRPPLGPIYSLSALELQTLREFLNKNLRTGIIRLSNSPCSVPVLFMKKKNGSLRLCVDYRGLNKLTQKDRYPIPLLSDLLDASNKARIYSKIDLKGAYHLVHITSGCKGITQRQVPFKLVDSPGS